MRGRDGPPDKRLFRSARQGDRRAYVLLLRRYDMRLRRLVLRLVAEPDRVDPILRRAYVRAWRSLAAMQPPGSVAEWLYRVVYNTCINELRWAPQRPPPPPPEGPRVPLPVASVERRLAGLRALTPEERIPLALVDGEGFSLEATARILQRPPVAVAADLSRARGRWRAFVVGDDAHAAERPEVVELEPTPEQEKLAAAIADEVEAPAVQRRHVRVVAPTDGNGTQPPTPSTPPPPALASPPSTTKADEPPATTAAGPTGTQQETDPAPATPVGAAPTGKQAEIDPTLGEASATSAGSSAASPEKVDEGIVSVRRDAAPTSSAAVQADASSGRDGLTTPTKKPRRGRRRSATKASPTAADTTKAADVAAARTGRAETTEPASAAIASPPSVQPTDGAQPTQGEPPTDGVQPIDGVQQGDGVPPTEGVPQGDGVPSAQGVPPTDGVPQGDGVPSAQGVPQGDGVPSAQGGPPIDGEPSTDGVKGNAGDGRSAPAVDQQPLTSEAASEPTASGDASASAGLSAPGDLSAAADPSTDGEAAASSSARPKRSRRSAGRRSSAASVKPGDVSDASGTNGAEPSNPSADAPPPPSDANVAGRDGTGEASLSATGTGARRKRRRDAKRDGRSRTRNVTTKGPATDAAPATTDGVADAKASGDDREGT